MEYILVIPIVIVCFIIVFAVFGVFMLPLMHWEELKRNRKQLNISITKWDYAQELILVVIIPMSLMGLGVRYLVELLDLKF
jgi:amino acid transporter